MNKVFWKLGRYNNEKTMKKVVCLDKDKNQHEIPVSELAFRPSVYGVIIKDGKILLSKQWDGYDLPGGGVDLGERIEDALVREVKEETGLDVEVGELAWCEDSFFVWKEEKMHSILIYYTCKVVGGKLSIDDIDESEEEYIGMPEWVSVDEIENLKFYNSIDTVEVIKKALRSN
jgi:ADP-ribose pyrophosphatase YjhB (NUDIX family)